MVIDYPCKPNGMFVLSKTQLDGLATRVLKNFMPEVLDHPQPVDIEYLLEEKLNLTIKNKRLDFNSEILGVTVFEDEEIPCLDNMYREITISVPAGTILIHTELQGYINTARRNFTIAHEGGHWMLHRQYHSPTNQKYQLRTQRPAYIACRSVNIESKKRNLKTDEDWEEWQADTMAAALLMPHDMFSFYSGGLIRKTGNRCLTDKRSRVYIEIIEEIAYRFMVSKTAAEIRLKQLGFIEKESENKKIFSY